MIKITVQEMKNGHKSSMGTTFTENVATMPEIYYFKPEVVKVENCHYTRVGGNKKTYKVIAVNARENERVVTLELYCE